MYLPVQQAENKIPPSPNSDCQIFSSLQSSPKATYILMQPTAKLFSLFYREPVVSLKSLTNHILYK